MAINRFLETFLYWVVSVIVIYAIEPQWGLTLVLARLGGFFLPYYLAQESTIAWLKRIGVSEVASGAVTFVFFFLIYGLIYAVIYYSLVAR